MTYNAFGVSFLAQPKLVATRTGLGWFFKRDPHLYSWVPGDNYSST